MVHTLLDRAARLPLFFLVSPANANDLPWFGRFVFGLPIPGVRADGAYWGAALVRSRLIPSSRSTAVRHLVWWPVSYAARPIIERFFATAKRYYHLDTGYAIGWESVVFSAILVVALAAYQSGAPELRLSPTRVLAHYLPVQDALEASL